MPNNKNTGHLPSNDVEILGVDYLDFMWPTYKQAVPNPDSLRMVPSTTEAEYAFKYGFSGAVQAVVVQLSAKWRSSDLFFNKGNSYSFVQWLLQRHFRGPIFVVSTQFTDEDRRRFEEISPGQIKVMDKSEFFRDAKTLLAKPSQQPTARQVIKQHRNELRGSSPDGANWATGPQQALESLKALGRVIRSGSPQQVFQHLTMLGIHSNGECDCTEDDQQSVDGLWFHENHGLYNRAMHELLAEHAMLDAVRKELELELAEPEHWVVCDPHSEHGFREVSEPPADEARSPRWLLRKDYALELPAEPISQTAEGPFCGLVRKDFGESLRAFLRESPHLRRWFDYWPNSRQTS